MAYKYSVKSLKPFPEVGFIRFYTKSLNIPLLKTLCNWATFTTQLILRLKTSVMKRAWTNDIQITVWED